MCPLYHMWKAWPQERCLFGKRRGAAERVGVRSATDMETPDKELEIAPGVKEVERCCVCGATDLLVSVDRENCRRA